MVFCESRDGWFQGYSKDFQLAKGSTAAEMRWEKLVKRAMRVKKRIA